MNLFSPNRDSLKDVPLPESREDVLKLDREGFRLLVRKCLDIQGRYCAQYVVGLLDFGFISDDSNDYMSGALSATETLRMIDYEGSPEDLAHVLFSQNPYDNSIYNPLYNEACDGIAPELANIAFRDEDD